MQISFSGDGYGRSEEAVATLAALQTIGLGVLYLDPDGAVCYANPEAAHELREGDALAAENGRLVARQPRQNGAVRHALEAARGSARTMVRLGVGEVARMFTFVPLAVQLGREGAAGLPTMAARTLVVWGASPQHLRFTMHLFAKATGLTASECEVLQELCRGLPAQDIATRRSVKLTTVRTQIGSIRSKLGARSVHAVIAGTLALPPLSPRLLG